MTDFVSTIFFGVVIIPFAILIRLPFLNFPIDEDFAFYSYTAHFRKRGVRLVKDFWGAFFPWLCYLKIGAYKICKEDIRKLRFFFSIYNTFTAGAIYLVASHLYGKGEGILSAILYCIFSATPRLGSYSINAEKYYILPITLSLYFLTIGMENNQNKYLFLASALIGIAFSLKPVVIVHLAAFAIYTTLYGGWEKTAFFLATFLIVIFTIFFLVLVIFRKNISELWIQNKLRIMGAISHIGQPLDVLERFVVDFVPLFKETSFLWVCAIYYFFFSLSEMSASHMVMWLWISSTILIIIGQRAFWQYQYIPLILVFSVAGSVSTINIVHQLLAGYTASTFLWAFLFCLSLFYSLAKLSPYYSTTKDWRKILNTFRKTDQYLHLPLLGQYIKEHSTETDYIYAWGPWTNIYTLTDRRSCEKSAFHFIRPYKNIHEIQYDETIAGIIEKTPQFIIQIFSNFDIEYLNKLTGLSYKIVRVFFNRYFIYKLDAQGKYGEGLYHPHEPWDKKKEKLEALTAGAREHRIYSYWLEQGDKEQYLREFQEALEANPFDVDTLVYLGVYHRDLSEFDKAFQYMHRALSIKKNQAWVHFELAQIHGAMGQKALERQELLKAKNNIFPYSAGHLKQLAIIHRRLENFEKSLRIYKFLSKYSHPTERLFFDLGILYREMKKYREAIECFKKELSLYPQGEWKYFHLGMACKDAGLLEKALEYMNKELSLYPQGEWKYFHLGMACKDAGMIENALEYMNKELTLYPQGEWKYYELGMLYLTINNLSDASLCFEKELGICPDKPYVHYLAASAFKKRGDLDKALDHFQKVTQLNSSSDKDKAGGHYHIGTILMTKGKTSEAVAEFRKCLLLLPDHKMALKQMELLGVEA